MTDVTDQAVIARAEKAVGARFRLHGRDIASGLDCIGLALWALTGSSESMIVPRGYRLRGGKLAQIDVVAGRLGLKRCADAVPAAVAVVRPSPIQLHLIVMIEVGFIHADAGLGRVVAVKAGPPWPILCCYRHSSEEGA